MLDNAGLYAATLDTAGGVARVRRGGVLVAAEAVASVPPGLLLREVVAARQASGHPVLVQSDGCLVGVCDEGDVMAALSGAGRAEAGRAMAVVA